MSLWNKNLKIYFSICICKHVDEMFFVFVQDLKQRKKYFSLSYCTLPVSCKYDLTKNHKIIVWIFISFLNYKSEMISSALSICLFFPMTHPQSNVSLLIGQKQGDNLCVAIKLKHILISTGLSRVSERLLICYICSHRQMICM